MIQRVFISSTSLDLSEYRQRAIDTCLKLGLLPVAMEYFEAMEEDAIRGSRKQLEKADIYVGIFAHRYGYIPDEEGRSITEMEYDFARERKIPCLIFVVDPEASWPAHFIDKENDAVLLRKFKQEKVMREKIVSFFRSSDEFATKLSISLIQVISSLETGKNPELFLPSLKMNQMIVEPMFGLPSQSTQFHTDIFMIAPFTDEFRMIYKYVIFPSVNSFGLVIKQADDFFSPNSILFEIWSAIATCRIVIADVSGRNPNVYYELGMAHTIGKPAIILSQNIDDVTFDIRMMRTIIYNSSVQGLKDLGNNLKSAIAKLL